MIRHFACAGGNTFLRRLRRPVRSPSADYQNPYLVLTATDGEKRDSRHRDVCVRLPVRSALELQKLAEQSGGSLCTSFCLCQLSNCGRVGHIGIKMRTKGPCAGAGGRSWSTYPPPPSLQTPTPCNPPPPANSHPLQSPPPPRGDRHFHVFQVNMYCAGLLPICFTHGLALLSHYFKSSTCVCSVISSLQRHCMGVLCCYFRPKMFSPGDHVQYHNTPRACHAN